MPGTIILVPEPHQAPLSPESLPVFVGLLTVVSNRGSPAEKSEIPHLVNLQPCRTAASPGATFHLPCPYAVVRFRASMERRLLPSFPLPTHYTQGVSITSSHTSLLVAVNSKWGKPENLIPVKGLICFVGITKERNTLIFDEIERYFRPMTWLCGVARATRWCGSIRRLALLGLAV